MITHVVIFTWNAEATPERVQALSQKLDRMVDALEQPATVRHGPDLAFRQGNGDYALIATFPDRASWAAYQADPAHQAFVRDVVTPLQARRVAIQF